MVYICPGGNCTGIAIFFLTKCHIWNTLLYRGLDTLKTSKFVPKNVGAAPSCPQVRILLVPLRCHPAPQYSDLLFQDRIHFWDKMKLTTLLMKTNLSIWTKLVRLMKGPFNMSIYLAKVSSSKMNQVVLRSVSRSLTCVCNWGVAMQFSKMR